MSEVIVLVDDEPYILHVLAIKLRNAGYEVFTAADGQEAVEVCLNATPDLIITDYQMPYLNGLEFCLKYRESSDRKIPAILITAREFDVESDKMSAAGIELVLSKPFSPRKIIELVDTTLNKYKVPSSAA
jgi:two-component system, OmpR family, alkaline phosphatase synthesis response regulator PhoP